MENDHIIGELKEFKRATLERLDTMDGKLDKLAQARWKIDGMTTLAVFLISLATTGIEIWIFK